MDGVSMQRALLDCQVVSEERLSDAGSVLWQSLRLGTKLIPLGSDLGFAKSLAFATHRNAEAFENSTRCWNRNAKLMEALNKIVSAPNLETAVSIATEMVTIRADAPPPTDSREG